MSIHPGNDYDSLTNFQAPAVREHLNTVLRLPPHPEEWDTTEVDISQGALNKFKQTGVVKQVRFSGEGSEGRHIWKTAQGISEYAQDVRDKQQRTPCGNATGIRTIEPGTYTCSYDDCDCRMDRETAQEVVA